MLGTSYKCVGRVERKIEDREANQRLVTVRSHPIARGGGTKEEALSLEPRGWMPNFSSLWRLNHKGIMKEELMLLPEIPLGAARGRQKYMASPIHLPSILTPGPQIKQNQRKGSLRNALLGQFPVIPCRAGERQRVDLRAKKQLTGMTH